MKDSPQMPRRRAAPWLCQATIAALALLPFSAAAESGKWDPVNGRKTAVAAVGDCAAGKVEICRDGFRRALELQPLHPEFLQFLAGAEERLGNSATALEAMAAIHRQGFELAFDPPDEWVAKVVARPEYKKVYAETAPLRSTIAASREAFRLPYRELVPESVVHDPKSGDFFVGGVHQPRIVRWNAKDGPRDFVPAGRDGLWSVLGMAVDAPRRRLWATSTAYPAMAGYQENLEGSSALFAFDLDSGKLVGRYEGSKPGKKGFNDVRVAPDGAIFVTDHEERPGTLYRLDPQTAAAKSGKLEPFGDPDALGSPEGLTFSPDGRYLFVADYSYGIVRFELATGKHLYLPDPPETTLVGLDHVDFHRGALVAVQNGNRPNSVIRLRLSPEWDRILGVETLERGLASYSEPTLGVLVGDDFYYVATSNWGHVDDDGKLAPADQLAEPLILRLPLGQ